MLSTLPEPSKNGYDFDIGALGYCNFAVARAQDIINGNKNVTDWGKWQTGGMPSSTFPLSKRRGRSYRLGAAYRWRLIRFISEGYRLRLLLAYNLDKQQYRAILAVEADSDMTVVASYEYHGTHPGWHVSAACGDIGIIPQGVMIGPWQSRRPRTRSFHRHREFGVTGDDSALNVAERFFKLHKREGVLL